MPKHPLETDPYEDETVYVKPVKFKGDGLFAKRSISKGDLCSIYAGCKLLIEKEESRDWSYNSNTVQLDDMYCVDVPKPYDSYQIYKASLGHKANHGFGSEVNADYMELFHP